MFFFYVSKLVVGNLKGQSRHDFVLLENPTDGVGINWKSTNSFLTLLKRTLLVTKVQEGSSGRDSYLLRNRIRFTHPKNKASDPSSCFNPSLQSHGGRM